MGVAGSLVPSSNQGRHLPVIWYPRGPQTTSVLVCGKKRDLLWCIFHNEGTINLTDTEANPLDTMTSPSSILPALKDYVYWPLWFQTLCPFQNPLHFKTCHPWHNSYIFIGSIPHFETALNLRPYFLGERVVLKCRFQCTYTDKKNRHQ